MFTSTLPGSHSMFAWTLALQLASHSASTLGARMVPVQRGSVYSTEQPPRHSPEQLAWPLTQHSPEHSPWQPAEQVP